MLGASSKILKNFDILDESNKEKIMEMANKYFLGGKGDFGTVDFLKGIIPINISSNKFIQQLFTEKKDTEGNFFQMLKQQADEILANK